MNSSGAEWRRQRRQSDATTTSYFIIVGRFYAITLAFAYIITTRKYAPEKNAQNLARRPTMTVPKKCLKYVCWALLFTAVSLGFPKLCTGHGHNHYNDHHHHGHAGSKTAAVDSMLWVKALSSTVAISVLPFFVLFFIPIENKDEHQPFLKILLSFASGGLLGDAFLHLIPHSLSTHHHHGHQDDHHHNHGHCSIDSHAAEEAHDHDNETRVGLWILTGILVFLFVEKIVRVIKGSHSHSHSLHQPKEKLSDDEGDDNDKNVNRTSEL